MQPSQAAMNYLASVGVSDLDLAVGEVREHDWGWTVHVNTATYWKTKDPMTMLVGLSPVFVSHQFRCKTFATGLSFQQMCEEFALECAAPG